MARPRKPGPRTASGRPYRGHARPPPRDDGTAEGQRKRVWLVNGADPALAAAATGILFARGYIDREMYAAAERYGMLQGTIFGRPYRQMCVIGRELGGGAKPELDDDELAERRRALDAMHRRLTPEQRSAVASLACYGLIPMWFVAEREGLRPLPSDAREKAALLTGLEALARS